MKRHPHLSRLLCVLCLLASSLTGRAEAAPASVYQPAQNQPILTMDKIVPGMKGYGLSVFHGTEITPFAVEVVSTNYGIAPDVGTIWIHCPDKRMQLNGVVQGMSGSPIYLWPKDLPEDQRIIGKNGLLIGAFAFGYGRTKDCFVGVKPIALMRDVAKRATTESIKDIKAAAKDAKLDAAKQMLNSLSNMAMMQHLPEGQIKMLDEYVKLASGPTTDQKQSTQWHPATPSNLPVDESMMTKSMLMPMPISGNTPGLATMVSPLFEPLGIQPVEAPAGTTSQLPKWINADKIQLRPGSSLVVPLAWGDMDMAAVGTVTDVLADGTVLGFGHAMSNDGKQGIGTLNLPVATGFIHLVMPSNDISFKLGGSARIAGTLIRDENSAVIAVGQQYFDKATLTIKVHQYQHEPRTYHYQVARHPQYTPLLSAILAVQSLNALSGAPTHNTLKMHAKMTFENDQTLEIDRIIPGGAPMEILVSLLPPISLMANNAFQSVPLKHMDVQMDIVPELNIGSIIQASLDQTEIAPGHDIGINFTVLPFAKPEKKFRTMLHIPANTPDGDYQLMIVGARTYAAMMLNNRPHRTQATNVDQLLQALRMLNGGVDDSVYVLLQTKDKGIAIGQNELPDLPSSRLALITNPTSTVATPYTQWIEKNVNTGLVVRTNVMFTLGIRSNMAEPNKAN